MTIRMIALIVLLPLLLLHLTHRLVLSSLLVSTVHVPRTASGLCFSFLCSRLTVSTWREAPAHMLSP